MAKIYFLVFAFALWAAGQRVGCSAEIGGDFLSFGKICPSFSTFAIDLLPVTPFPLPPSGVKGDWE